MTKLLISVKSTAEAILALEAGADFIDLKDPKVGALGSLDNALSKDIVQAVNKKAVISATIGEDHPHKLALLEAIDRKVEIGVDIVKLAISDYFNDVTFLQQLQAKISSEHIKLVAVIFADEVFDFHLIKKLAEIGFYGVMLDTQNKQQNLLSVISEEDIHFFVKSCKKQGLQAGLAGSLRVECIHDLLNYFPSYLGFRSGVCLEFVRDSGLDADLIKMVKNTLYKHNKTNTRVYV
jgi:(5-formylfuran-3-yl)methyl phosphate synthase